MRAAISGTPSSNAAPTVTRPIFQYHRSFTYRPPDRSFFVWCSESLQRPQRRGQPSVSKLWFVIAGVVLCQNALMAYTFARRAGVGYAAARAVHENEIAFNLSHTPQSGGVDSLPTQVIAAHDPAVVTLRHTASSTIRTLSLSLTDLRQVGDLEIPVDAKNQRTYFRKRTTRVNAYTHKQLLMPTKLCDADTLMVILIHSGTNNVEKRAAIRETWGGAAKTGMWPNEQQNGSCAGLRLAFVLGLHVNEEINSAVQQEYALYGDIIQGNFIDSYRNMTLKSLLDLKMVDEYCPGVPYLLKTDDDMIVNLPYLLELLVNKGLQRSIMGPVNVGARVHRSGKWKLTTEEFPFGFFPPYESGSAYVITGDLIHELFVTAEYVPQIFVDDVYVTGILGRIVGVNHVVHSGFAFWHSKPPAVCDIVQNRIVSGTKMNPILLRTMWKQLYKPQCPVS